MNLIYEPRGPAKEYAPLALNLYAGCPHGCRYCYVPGCLRCSAADFAARAGRPRAGFEPDGPGWRKLEREAAALAAAGDQREILLSFTSDPYQEAEKELHLTRRALEHLRSWWFSAFNRPATVLTKRPALAWGLDRGLLLAGHFRLATSVTGLGLDWRNRWEPDCAKTGWQRLSALAAARKDGISTWVSLEPVIDPAEGLAVLRRIVEVQAAPHVKIGKLNHHPEWIAGVDWPAFVAEAREVAAKGGLEISWKESLRPYLKEAGR
jgi:DNA repair photolyase